MSETLTVKIKRSMYMVPLEQIVYMENELRKIRMHTTDERGEYCFYGTFRQVSEELDSRFFGSRTYILNGQHIRALVDEAGEYEVVMGNGDRISLCKNSFLKVKEQYETWLAEKDEISSGKKR